MTEISNEIFLIGQLRNTTLQFSNGLPTKESIPTTIIANVAKTQLAPQLNIINLELVKNYADLVENWPERDHYQEVQQNLRLISTTIQNGFNGVGSDTWTQTELRQWLAQCEATQLRYQHYMNALNTFLSRADTGKITLFVLSNSVILATLFTIIFQLNQRQHHLNLASQQGLNDQLEDKNQRLQRSQKQLASILEDVKIEKERAVNMAVENEQLIQLVEQEREQLQLVIEQAPNALIMVDDKGNIVIANEQSERLFGYPAKTLIGVSIDALVPDAIRALHPSLRQTFFNNPRARSMGAGRDLSARHNDGHEIPVEIGLNPITTSSGRFVVTSIVDLTERRKSQQLLEDINDALSRRNEEMEQFVYTVSHDLKSPLVTIGSFAQKLRQELISQITPRQSHKLERIIYNVVHMETLLADLLQLSRVIRQNIERSEIDLNHIINEVCELNEAAITAANGRIQIQTPLHSVVGNRGLITQCLQNLIANAVNYRDTNRDLLISFTTHIACAEKTPDIVILNIQDNGLGIDPKYHKQIFRIFERLDVGEGTGVGLAIVKTVMEKHQGKVTLESEPGIGSTFSLHFPTIHFEQEAAQTVQ